MADEAPKEDAASEEPAKKTLLTKTQWMLFGGALLVLILLSVGITVLLSQPGTTPEPATQAGTELEVQVEALEKRISVYEKRLAEMSETLAMVRTRPRRDLTPELLEQLMEQERSTQQLIGVIKEGIGDLSRMIPGSRDWLELYSEQLKEVRSQSKLRLERLQTLGLPESDPPESE